MSGSWLRTRSKKQTCSRPKAAYCHTRTLAGARQVDLLRCCNGGRPSLWDRDQAGRDKGGVDRGGSVCVRRKADDRRLHGDVYEERRVEETRRQRKPSVRRKYGFLPSLGSRTVWGPQTGRISSAVLLSQLHALDGRVVFSYPIDIFVFSNLVYDQYSLDYP